MNKKPILLYIHGLDSNRYSRKFIALQHYFENDFHFDFVEWDIDSNIEQLLLQTIDKYSKEQPLLIIGDSMGANFACQLRTLRGNRNDRLILTSPLLCLDKTLIAIDLPQSIRKQIISIPSPHDALIIFTSKDEILDQTWLSNAQLSNIELLEVDDNHRLENFDEILPSIRLYLSK